METFRQKKRDSQRERERGKLVLRSTKVFIKKQPVFPAIQAYCTNRRKEKRSTILQTTTREI